MSIDWEKFDNDLSQSIEESVRTVDAKLATQMSSITRLTDEEINELFPEPADLQNLSELLKVVKSAETKNNKVNAIISNSEKFAKVTLQLLEKLT